MEVGDGGVAVDDPFRQGIRLIGKHGDWLVRQQYAPSGPTRAGDANRGTAYRVPMSEALCVTPIQDADDPRLRPYRNLRGRGDDDGFIAEGHFVVQRMLQSGLLPDSVWVQEHACLDELRGLPPTVPIYRSCKSLFADVVGYSFHRGVLAHGPVPPRRDLAAAETILWPAVSLALVDVTDGENVGSLLRSAAAMNIDQIMLSPQTISPFARRVIRVSMASVFFQTFWRLDDPIAQVRRWREMGITTIATTLSRDSITIDDLTTASPDNPCVLMVGNEAMGLDDELQEACDVRVTLPMTGPADSLNVAVAGAIFLHELTRRRRDQ